MKKINPPLFIANIAVVAILHFGKNTNQQHKAINRSFVYLNHRTKEILTLAIDKLNRRRGETLPKVYDALSSSVLEQKTTTKNWQDKPLWKTN